MCFLRNVANWPVNAVTKVAENNVTVRVDKDILLLYVTVYNVMGMNVLNSKKLP
jgi:hypothetical protein